MSLQKGKKGSFLFIFNRQLHVVKECGIKNYLTEQWLRVVCPLWSRARVEGKLWWGECSQWMSDSLRQGQVALLEQLGDLGTVKRRLEFKGVFRKPVFYAAIFSGLLMIWGTIYLGENQIAYAAYYHGRELGVVSSQSACDGLVLQVERDQEQRLGQHVFLSDQLEFRLCRTPRANLVAQKEIEQSLLALPWQTDGVQLVVNGKPVMLLENNQVANRVLDQVKKSFQKLLPGEKVEDIRFSDKIVVQKKRVALKDLIDEDQAVSLLANGRVQVSSYQVQYGDTLWSIARAHNLLVADLQQANPGLTTPHLDIGQKLKLTTVEPLVNVEMASTLVSNESIPFDVQAQTDNRLRRGSTKVIQDGIPGQRVATYQLVKHNGQVMVKNLLAIMTLKNPVAKVIAEGTRGSTYLAYSGNGRVSSTAYRGGGGGVLSWPVRGPISSGYGYRGSEFHTGIDIEAGTGSAVHAAASGRVVSAGWGGGYGKTIVINHGNGMETRYAHLSLINISVGESVGAGEVIGAVGATGRATGPHLHFEVLDSGGGNHNPFNYLR